MKELSIEEKAKAYDEAIERVKNYYSTTDSSADIKLIGLMFPELREESEDERIRKGIIRNLEYLMDRAEGFVKDELKERIAWLEKQGSQNLANSEKTCKDEQKPADKVEHKFKVGDIIRLKGTAVEYTIRRVTDTTYYTDGWSCGIERCEEDYELVEQNPAWSEEDEINLGKAIWYAENPAPMVTKDSMLVEWLKNLKGRVQPQPKQEWSEEDEIRLSDAVFFVREYQIPTRDKRLLNAAKEAEEWLKSLRPYSQWKPSELQLECLDDAIKHYQSKGSRPVILMELLEELKKL